MKGAEKRDESECQFLFFFTPILQEGRLKRGADYKDKGGDETDDKDSDAVGSGTEADKSGKKRHGLKSVAQAAAKTASHKLSPKTGRKKTKPSVALMKVRKSIKVFLVLHLSKYGCFFSKFNGLIFLDFLGLSQRVGISDRV